MQRYTISQFDASTFQVVDLFEQREICVCADYDDWEDSKERAQKIANILNEKENRHSQLSVVGHIMQFLKGYK